MKHTTERDDEPVKEKEIVNTEDEMVVSKKPVAKRFGKQNMKGRGAGKNPPKSVRNKKFQKKKSKSGSGFGKFAKRK